MSSTHAHLAQTRLVRKLVKSILGFGISVAVGLAPYLGKYDIPFFSPLLDLIPESLHASIFPLSSAFMGVLAVAVQWYAGERVTHAWLGKLFRRTLLCSLITFIVLGVIHILVVVKVPIPAINDSATFLVGFKRPVRPPCTAEVSDAECIQKITLDEAAIASFWGDAQIRRAALSLTLAYLLFMGTFGVMIGLLLLRDEAQLPFLSGVTISPTAATVKVQGKSRFTAHVFDQFDRPLTKATVTFTSSDPTVAMIDSSAGELHTNTATGSFRGLKAGTVSITATARKGKHSVDSIPATLTVI
jgi:hypothetical protein